jgi:hypothetical protein
MSTPTTYEADVLYPDSDGQPMADNTLQWDWMVKIVGELRELFAGKDVFVAGDLLWYPVRGEPKIRSAPDAMVVFGRPPGYRGSYKQWEEGNVSPHVVFEILSPSNTDEELDAKLDFYERFGVEEYYFIDPYEHKLIGYHRVGDRLRPVHRMNGFVSPRLGIKFEANGVVNLYTPDGREFQTREDRIDELLDELKRAKKEADAAKMDLEIEKARVEIVSQKIQQERATKDKLAARLRELGIDPDSV